MKYVKLILIVAVVAGLIYGALSIMGPSTGDTKISGDSPTLLTDLKKKVDRDWDNADKWDQSVYEKNINDANVYHKDLENIASGNYSTLIDYTNEKVCNKLVGFINSEFALSTCAQSKINQMKNDLDYFVKNNSSIASSDSRIKDAYAKINLYTQILSFGKKQFGLSSGFDINSGKWNDFSAYSNNQVKIRDSFKKAPQYSSLSHISDVKNSLNSVDSKLSSARSQFEANLSRDIRTAYSSVDRNEENQKSLQEVYNRYYQSYNDEKKLSTFRKNFIDEVKEAKANKNN